MALLVLNDEYPVAQREMRIRVVLGVSDAIELLRSIKLVIRAGFSVEQLESSEPKSDQLSVTGSNHGGRLNADFH